MPNIKGFKQIERRDQEKNNVNIAPKFSEGVRRSLA